MIVCIIADCGGTNLRNVDRLTLIIDIGMGCYLFVFGIQSFKYNSGCSFKSSCIKSKDNFYASFSSAVKVVDAVTGFPFTRIFAPVL